MSATLKTIPLCNLQRAQSNVRKTGRDAEIKALAASIEAHGLLQNLTVRAVNANGKPNGRFEVVAGGRRLAALKKLARSKRIARDFPVPCAVLEDGEGRPEELSLAENFERLPLHPADQFDAFHALSAAGMAAGEIAARFGIAERLVLQRLKLAQVSPKLVALYRENGMTLEQLMAFAVSDDHDAQERAWSENPYGHQSPDAIRRALTSSMVESGDRRVRFVGAPAYEAAGGTIVRDLFSEEGEGYFADSVLLDRLVADKLAEEARAIEAEGWSWIEALPEMDYGNLARYGRVPPVDGLTDKEKARLADHCDRYDKLVEELGDDPTEQETARLDKIEARIEALSRKRDRWRDEDKAEAGALVSIDHDGGFLVVRGLVRPEDRKPQESAEADRPSESKPKPADGISDALRENLSAHRTAALRAELADRGNVAFVALLHALVSEVFFGAGDCCIELSVSSEELGRHGNGVKECRALQTLVDRHAQWAERLPAEEGLWEWLMRLEDEDESSLLAYCVATSVNAVWRKGDRPDAERFAEVDILAKAVGLDMANWWQPSRESYFDHVPKEAIRKAVAEGASAQVAENLSGLKKPEMAARAEELLQNSGWLPAPLRAKDHTLA